MLCLDVRLLHVQYLKQRSLSLSLKESPARGKESVPWSEGDSGKGRVVIGVSVTQGRDRRCSNTTGPPPPVI